MRFPLASLFLLISSFIFFMFWVFGSKLIDVTKDAMMPLATKLGEASYTNQLTLIPTAFGIICAIFFVTGILSIFILDSLADEPEMYYRR